VESFGQPYLTILRAMYRGFPKKFVISMKRRNLLFRRAKKSGNFSKYKSLRNKLVNAFHQAKSAYLRRLLIQGILRIFSGKL
jgi:hypothetical protein